MDPDGPAPGAGDGQLLDTIDRDFVETLVEKTVGSPLLSVEVRHLGGEIGRARAHHGALPAFEGEYLMFAVGIAPTPEAKHAIEASVQDLLGSLEPWAAEHTYLNFADTRRKAVTLFSSMSYHRLRRIKAIVDPTDRIRSNHPIPPARQ
jgi:Berberine and berberine like